MSPLNAVEVRVLGALVEKQLTTPEYYPLTLNALTNACNQKSNRDPVVSFDEATVVRGLDGLRARKLALVVSGGFSRVPKYQHTVSEELGLSVEERAVLCVLLLRGPQTVGEIRSRTERMARFEELAAAEAVIRALAAREPALATELPLQPGRKEARWAHLLAGPPEIEEPGDAPRPEAATLQVRAENERIARLEEEVDALRQEIESLRQQLAGFRRQFE